MLNLAAVAVAINAEKIADFASCLGAAINLRRLIFLNKRKPASKFSLEQRLLLG